MRGPAFDGPPCDRPACAASAGPASAGPAFAGFDGPPFDPLEGLVGSALALAHTLELRISRVELGVLQSSAGADELLRAARAQGLEPARSLLEPAQEAAGERARLTVWVEAHDRVAPLAQVVAGAEGCHLEVLPHPALVELFRATPEEPPAWPPGLAPEQVHVLPVHPAHAGRAEALCAALREDGVRVGSSLRGPLRQRVGAATARRVPWVVVVGDEAPQQVALRERGSPAVERLSPQVLRDQVGARIRITSPEGSSGIARVPGPAAAKVAAARRSPTRALRSSHMGRPSQERVS